MYVRTHIYSYKVYIRTCTYAYTNIYSLMHTYTHRYVYTYMGTYVQYYAHTVCVRTYVRTYCDVQNLSECIGWIFDVCASLPSGVGEVALSRVPRSPSHVAHGECNRLAAKNFRATTAVAFRNKTTIFQSTSTCHIRKLYCDRSCVIHLYSSGFNCIVLNWEIGPGSYSKWFVLVSRRAAYPQQLAFAQ